MAPTCIGEIELNASVVNTRGYGENACIIIPADSDDADNSRLETNELRRQDVGV